MSAVSFDHVCDPASMFQDTFSLSEFLLGQPEDDCMQSSSFSMPSSQAKMIKEEIDSEGEYQEQVR